MATAGPTKPKRGQKTGSQKVENGQQHDRTRELTPAAVWRSVAGEPITDDLLGWPPDLFALTYVLLERSQAGRFAVSPPAGCTWPPTRLQSWHHLVEVSGRQWSGWLEDQPGFTARAPGRGVSRPLRP